MHDHDVRSTPARLSSRRQRPQALRRALLAATGVALVVAGCAVEFENPKALASLDKQGAAPGSVYTGWRVFQDRCARCHGTAGTGSADAPDLVARARTMGPRRFVESVLQRYDWRLPPTGSDEAARETLVDRIVQRQAGSMTMPAWDGEPLVNAHIADLYAYLAARAEGTQGPGRPAQ